jgi:hypothetical protein
VQPIVFHHIMDRVRAAGWQIQQTGAGLEILLAQPDEVDPSMLAGISAQRWRPKESCHQRCTSTK